MEVEYVQEKETSWLDLLLFGCWDDNPVYDARLGVLTCRRAYSHGFLVCIREVRYVKEMKIRVIKLPRFVGSILKKILRVKD